MIYEFKRDPYMDQYAQFISFACDHSDAVMMVFLTEKGNSKENNSINNIRFHLSPWRIKSRHDPQWPVTICKDKKTMCTIDLYAPSAEIKSFLLSINHLFGWGTELPPTDIAFFQHNYCWIATCSHEKYGWVKAEMPLPTNYLDYLSPVNDPNDLTFFEEY